MKRWSFIVLLVFGFWIFNGTEETAKPLPIYAQEDGKHHTPAGIEVSALLGQNGGLVGSGQHPQIITVRHYSLFNYERREFEQFVEVDIVNDDIGQDTAGTITFISREFPYETWEVQLPWQAARRRMAHNQLLTFTNYTSSILDCRWQDKEAHVYDHPATWNPAGKLTIQKYAWVLFAAMLDENWQRVDCGAHQQDPPPPVNLPPPPPVCEPTAVPHIDDLTPEGNSFFYTFVELSDGDTYVQLGFAHDGNSWQLFEQHGEVSGGDCQEQLGQFTNYTLAILTAPTCTAVPIYTPEEEAIIAWYVKEIENFCQSNQQAPHIVSVDWQSPTLFIVETQLKNGQTVGIEFEEHFLTQEPWWSFGQYYEPEDIVGAEAQAELFVMYTLETVNSCMNAFAYPQINLSLSEFISQLIINFCIAGGP